MKKNVYICIAESLCCTAQMNTTLRDFPGGAVVKNPPSNAGDAGSIPGRELRSHMPWGNEVRVPQLLSLRTLEPMHHN